MNSPAILVEGLRKTYGSVEALKGIDFEVPAGTIFGLLGPNGAGKTTAVRILSTILRPTAGRAEVLGYDVSADAAKVRHLIGLAGQSAAVDPNLTGRENLKLIGKLAQLDRNAISSRADELLHRFDLVEAGDRPIRTYSGGMRRRLDVAASLVGKPPVIFLDEPTTGLDIQSRTELWKVIEELVADGATVLLTTQYLEEADQLADRIAVIDDGIVVANDTASALKAKLGGTVVEIRMQGTQEASAAAELLSRLDLDPPEIEGTTIKFTTGDATHVLTQVLRSLDAAGLGAAGISVHEPSLDDVFLSLTGDGAKGAKPQLAGAAVRQAGGQLAAPERSAGSFDEILAGLAFKAGSGTVSSNLSEVIVSAVHHAAGSGRLDGRSHQLLAGYLALEQRFGRLGSRFRPEDGASLLLGAAGARGMRNGSGPEVGTFASETVRLLLEGIAGNETRIG